MQRYITCICLLALVATVSAADDKKPDTKPFQGHWAGWVVEGKGDKPNQGRVQIDLVITDNVIKATQIKAGEKQDLGQGTFELTLKDGVLLIDAKRTTNPGSGQLYEGICKVEGDTLRWCSNTPRKPRPTEFESKPGQFLLIVKKQEN